MHQFNWIEWLLDGNQSKSPISIGFIDLFVRTDKEISDHDALGCVLMGGEL